MRLNREDCVVMAVDYQERLIPAMYEKERLIQKSVMLLKGLALFEVPVLETRQYPKGLGETVPEMKEAMAAPTTLDKLYFDCCEEPSIQAALQESGRKTVILCGDEAHVCILQTVMGLKARGYTPVVVVDCVSSRKPEDLKYGLKRAKDEGAILTTAEALLFELLQIAKGDTFKAVSKLVK